MYLNHPSTSDVATKSCYKNLSLPKFILLEQRWHQLLFHPHCLHLQCPINDEQE